MIYFRVLRDHVRIFNKLYYLWDGLRYNGTIMPDSKKRRKAASEPLKKKAMPDITPPREEPGTSDEIVMSGRVYYAENKSTWDRDENRQYIASPEDRVDLQHGVVTWIDAATSDKNVNDELDRRLDAILRERGHKKKPPEYDL